MQGTIVRKALESGHSSSSSTSVKLANTLNKAMGALLAKPASSIALEGQLNPSKPAGVRPRYISNLSARLACTGGDQVLMAVCI